MTLSSGGGYDRNQMRGGNITGANVGITVRAGCLGGLLGIAALVAGCGPSGNAADAAKPSTRPPTTASSSATHSSTAGPARPAASALRAGERFLDLAVPGTYDPAAPNSGKDEYRCFLLDPALTADAFVTGVEVLPGQPAIVHHAIVFRVAPGDVSGAEAADARDPGKGWTCFGDAGIPGRSGAAQAVRTLDSAPWLAGWAPGSGESIFGAGTGVRLAAGSRLVLQVHYNLRAGARPDHTGLRLRLASGRAPLRPLETMLLVAPVELPCPSGQTGPLCVRENAVLDLMRRFGPQAGTTVAGLQLLCDGTLGPVHAGPTQHCDRQVQQSMVVRAVAGHMHLLGRSIKVVLNPGTSSARTLLDRAVWDFDNQRATPLPKPVKVRPGDTLRVTCTHDAGLRLLVPELQKEQPRYVTWGEGTSDEMCLGIVIYTRS
jgi:hypothetical protein